MSELRPELRKLFDAACGSDERPTDAPFGFASRMVAMAKSQPVESPLFLLESMIRRGTACALAVTLGVVAVCFATGLPKVELDAISKPYAAVFSLMQ